MVKNKFGFQLNVLKNTERKNQRDAFINELINNYVSLKINLSTKRYSDNTNII